MPNCEAFPNLSTGTAFLSYKSKFSSGVSLDWSSISADTLNCEKFFIDYSSLFWYHL